MATRRQFLVRSAFVSLSPWVPAFLPRSLAAAGTAADERILVVIQLDGGNDGLNTVIPYADENYARYRKELRIAEKDVLKLDDAAGLHPAMKPAAELFEQGRLTVVQGVGYPNPNRSHFRSMAIWQHARLDAADHDGIGWLGRAMDVSRDPASSTPDSVYVGSDAVPVALRGRRANAVSLENEADLTLTAGVREEGSERRSPTSKSSSRPLAPFLERTIDDSYEAARKFQESEGSRTGEAAYPGSMLGRKLRLVSRLIKLGGGTRVYYVSQPGYDTHAAQSTPHRRLLGEFSTALKAFLDDLKDARLEDRVAVMAFSEFGRQAKENGSAGTDHGAAAPLFLAGPAFRGGLIGEPPSLTDLGEVGDLKMSIDFRRIYAALLSDWLSINPRPVMTEHFDPLVLLRRT